MGEPAEESGDTEQKDEEGGCEACGDGFFDCEFASNGYCSDCLGMCQYT